MDGWKDDGMIEYINKFVDRWMGGRVNESIDELIYELIDE